MLKKTILLAAAAGFALSTSAFAEGTTQKELDKANKPAAQMKQDVKSGDTKAMKPSTTGSGTTAADPRDSNTPAKPADKARTEDAKQKGGQ